MRFSRAIVKPLEATYFPSMTSIAQALILIRQKIAHACQKSGRDPAAVTLVAVSKTQPRESIQAALDAGQRVFGENRVQEAATKFPTLKSRYPDLKLHLIGPLQTNKVIDSIRLFDVIETLDRPKLAEVIAKEAAKQGRCPHLYIQVNTGHEPQKAGVLPEALGALLTLCRSLGLKIDGLMCLPPAGQDPAPHFALLRRLAGQYGLKELSMGMSGDFEEAIAQGATHVRIGTALFGKRA